MTKQDMRTALLIRFPWLGTDDPVNGAEVIDTINQWYESLQERKPKPVAKFINTKKEFKWRIAYGKEVSPWYSFYQGLLVHKFADGRTFALATDYWNGRLPVEQVFEITAPFAMDLVSRGVLI